MSEETPKLIGEDDQRGETPVVRVFFFQGGRLEWLVPPAESEEVWKRRAAARAIFFLLLCAPNRQALRGQLTGILWPESEEEKARASFRSALKVLRKVIVTQQGDTLLETAQHGEVLRLKGQEAIWVDIDACETLAQQASRETDSYLALGLWQQARALLCGEFLAEDGLHEWANSRWIKVRRQQLLTVRRRMIRSLADLYIQQGQNAQAEEILYEHVIRFPMDQDALYRLMQLLIKAECFDEARFYYEQCKAHLTVLGKQPAHHLKALEVYLSAQSKEGAKTRLNKQLQHERVKTSSIAITSAEQESSLVHISRRELLREAPQVIGAALVLPDIVFDPSLPERLSHTLKKRSTVDQKTLDALEAVTQQKRQRFVLSAGSGWRELFRETSEHLNVVTQLLEQPLPELVYLSLCNIAGETALLLGDICFNAGWNETADAYYIVALESAYAARHNVLQAVVLGRKSFIPIYGRDPQKALPLLEEALRCTMQNTGDIISAWLWAVKAEAYAHMDRNDASSHALAEAAYLLDRGQPGNVSYAFAGEISHAIFSASKLLGFKGACLLRLGQSEAAQDVLYKQLDENAYIHHQSIILADLGMTYVQQLNIKQAYVCATQALTLIKKTESTRVLHRLFKLRHSLVPWEHTQHVRSLDHQIASLLIVR